MSFKPDELLATLNKQGGAKASHFEVQIDNPAAFVAEDRAIMFRADTAELPGRTISTSEYRATTGPIRKIAYASTYTDTTIGFICSADLREKLYFEQWQDMVMNHRSYRSESEHAKTGLHSVGYYDDYAKGRVVEIRTFDETGRRRTRHLFTEAYPIGIAPISLSWADDNIIRLNVTFAYRDYRTDFTPGEANPDAKPAGPSISGSIKIGNATIGGNIPLPSSPPSVSDVTVRPLPADDIIRRRL